ncbi:MAG: TetR/AcrR family transcriptional regulator [Lysobacterales bacterium]
MPWEKTFDVEQTLNRAMQAFWAHGYEATSMQDLVACTGVNRASLYATYGDKRELFIAALRLFDREQRKARLDDLEQRFAPRAAIAAFFRGFVRHAAGKDDRRGCFLTNTALELASHDAEVGRIVADSQADIEAFFRRLLKKGQAAGEFSAALDSKRAARGLLASLLGLLVLARSRPQPALLDDVVGDALDRLA